MNSPWIRISDIPKYFGVCRSKAFELAREFRYQADPKDYIKDGKITILRIDAFEEWWRNRGRRND